MKLTAVYGEAHRTRVCLNSLRITDVNAIQLSNIQILFVLISNTLEKYNQPIWSIDWASKKVIESNSFSFLKNAVSILRKKYPFEILQDVSTQNSTNYLNTDETS